MSNNFGWGFGYILWSSSMSRMRGVGVSFRGFVVRSCGYMFSDISVIADGIEKGFSYIFSTIWSILVKSLISSSDVQKGQDLFKPKMKPTALATRLPQFILHLSPGPPPLHPSNSPLTRHPSPSATSPSNLSTRPQLLPIRHQT